MPRPIQAELSLAALRHNLQVAKRASPQNKVWAVVKARAYGHGLLLALRGFAQADGLAVLDLEEAVQLRDAGWQRPILLLEGCFNVEDLKLAARLQLTLVVHREDQITMLEQGMLQQPLAIYLKMNTGMNRLGLAPSDYFAAYTRLQKLPHINHLTHMTHFANADALMTAKEKSPLTVQQQMQCFETIVGTLPGERSVANSAGLLGYPELRADWSRPGIMLYGSSPFAHCNAAKLDLRPVMTLRSEIIAIQNLQAGDHVGYGSLYRAERAMRIGVVACGYADGYPRHAPGMHDARHSSATPVLVNGQRTTMVGRVSMDMLAVDLTPLPEATIGAPVTLWGEGLSVDEVAHAAGTIGYELLCALSARVPRVEVE